MCGNASSHTIAVSLTIITLIALLLSLSLRDQLEPLPPTGSSRRIHPGRAGNIREKRLAYDLAEQKIQLDQLLAQVETLTVTQRDLESTIESNEASIRVLKQRLENEKTARSKAQWALSERVSAMDACQNQKEIVYSEAQACAAELASLRQLVA